MKYSSQLSLVLHEDTVIHTVTTLKKSTRSASSATEHSLSPLYFSEKHLSGPKQTYPRGLIVRQLRVCHRGSCLCSSTSSKVGVVSLQEEDRPACSAGLAHCISLLRGSGGWKRNNTEVK